MVKQAISQTPNLNKTFEASMLVGDKYYNVYCRLL